MQWSRDALKRAAKTCIADEDRTQPALLLLLLIPMNFIPYYVYMYICCTVEINSTLHILMESANQRSVETIQVTRATHHT